MLPRRKYRQCAYMAAMAAVWLYDAIIRDVGLAGFLVAILAGALLYFDRNWNRQRAWFTPFDRNEWFDN